MERDDIINTARRAWLSNYGQEVLAKGENVIVDLAGLTRFVEMIEAQLIEKGWRQCAKGQGTTQFCGQLNQAVEAQKEKDAKIAESWDNGSSASVARSIARCIRAQGDVA